MLRYILAILAIIVILRIGQDNPYISFAAITIPMMLFVFWSLNNVDNINKERERQMLKTIEGRRKIYYEINSK